MRVGVETHSDLWLVAPGATQRLPGNLRRPIIAGDRAEHAIQRDLPQTTSPSIPSR